MASSNKPCPPAEKLDEKKGQCPPVDNPLVVPGKTSWPELVGTNGEEAAAIIKKENPLVNPIIVKDNHLIQNYVSNRVWVIVDGAGNVIKVPTVG